MTLGLPFGWAITGPSETGWKPNELCRSTWAAAPFPGAWHAETGFSRNDVQRWRHPFTHASSGVNHPNGSAKLLLSWQ